MCLKNRLAFSTMPIQYSGLVQAFTKEECLEAVRQYEAVCKQQAIHPSRHGYQRWHMQTLETPSIGPIERFGTWNEMRRQAKEAGDEANKSISQQSARSKNYVWTEIDCQEALKQYSHECEVVAEEGTLQGYAKWSAGRQDLPSSVTVVKHLGREEAKCRAQGKTQPPRSPIASNRQVLKPRL